MNDEQYVVVTVYVRPGGSPLAHVYGAATQDEARKTRRQLLQDFNDDHHLADEGGALHVSVNKVLWVPSE